MPAICLARQPIVNVQREVHAYELLFRENVDAEEYDGDDGDRASAGIILRALMGLGLDRITSGRPAFINCTERLLSFEGLDFVLSPDLVVLEVLEDVKPEPAVIERLQRLSESGFRIALDDFQYDPAFAPFLEIADYVKIDLKTRGLQDLQRSRNKFPSHCALIAEKVETYEDFHRCVDLGFDYFQGWFICNPETLEGHLPAADRLTALQVIARLHEKDVAIDEVVRLVSLDPSLGYCVLRVANSSAYARPIEVNSVHEGVMRLGISGLRRWVSIMMMAGLDHKPRELLFTGIVRARMCEALGRQQGGDPDAMFTIGLFSILEAMFDRPLGHILADISLASHVTDALISGAGVGGQVLRAVVCFEQGGRAAPDHLILRAKLTEVWLEALDWTHAMLRGLGMASPLGAPARKPAAAK
jgi:c-di-GMP phosphodiesterase